MKLIRWTVFHKGQSHRVEQNGTDVEEMTVKQAAHQQGQQRAGGKPGLRGAIFYKDVDGLNAMDNVSGQAYDSATCQQLDDGVVPAGRDEAGEGFVGCPAPGDIFLIEEGTAQGRVLGEQGQTVLVDVVTGVGVEPLAQKGTEQIQQLLTEQSQYQQEAAHKHDQKAEGEQMALNIADRQDQAEQKDESAAEDGVSGAGENGTDHKQTAHQNAQHRLAIFDTEIEGEGQGHHQDRTHIVIHTPTGVDRSAVDHAVDQHISADIDPGLLTQRRSCVLQTTRLQHLRDAKKQQRFTRRLT